jgi:hypothetical protein
MARPSKGMWSPRPRPRLEASFGIFLGFSGETGCLIPSAFRN